MDLDQFEEWRDDALNGDAIGDDSIGGDLNISHLGIERRCAAESLVVFNL